MIKDYFIREEIRIALDGIKLKTRTP